MGYHREAAERIIRDTLTNVFQRGTAVEVAIRNLRAHANYCRTSGDEATGLVADGVAQELVAGAAPTLDLGGVKVVPPQGFELKRDALREVDTQREPETEPAAPVPPPGD